MGWIVSKEQRASAAFIVMLRGVTPSQRERGIKREHTELPMTLPFFFDWPDISDSDHDMWE